MFGFVGLFFVVVGNLFEGDVDGTLNMHIAGELLPVPRVSLRVDATAPDAPQPLTTSRHFRG